MRTFFKMILLAAPLVAFAQTAHGHKPRKVTIAVTAPVPPAAVVAPASPPGVTAPARSVVVATPAPVAVVPPPQVVAGSTARVTVVSPPPFAPAPPHVVAIEAPVPQVTYTVAPPAAAVQVQVSDSAYATVGPPVPVAYQAAPSCALRDESDLQAVIGAIKNESFSSDQLRVLSEAAQGTCFTVAQIEQVLPLFSFEADQLKALQIMAPRLVDRQNTFRIYGLFTFESGKQQARRILSR